MKNNVGWLLGFSSDCHLSFNHLWWVLLNMSPQFILLCIQPFYNQNRNQKVSNVTALILVSRVLLALARTGTLSKVFSFSSGARFWRFLLFNKIRNFRVVYKQIMDGQLLWATYRSLVRRQCHHPSRTGSTFKPEPASPIFEKKTLWLKIRF